jgi:SAM-dependent methyltransferase
MTRKHLHTLKEIHEYVQEDYWEDGKAKGVSGYITSEIDWWYSGRYVQWLDNAIGLKNKYFLDLGCANGATPGIVCLFGGRGFGIDLSDYAIERGKLQMPWMSNKLSSGSIHNLSKFKNNTFDVIHSQQVFEHLPAEYCGDLAKETYRVCKPGGFLWAGLVLDVSSKFTETGFNPEDPDLSHINIRTEDWWDNKFLSAGWKKDKATDSLIKKSVILPDNLNIYEEFKWHTICYVKR